mmetsp:Transcript_56468/g.162058  ORF Transcript_56468/g.162058 Transcript_56468/m.162058 type:complete len:320 (-) Transcript_56468:127-1086(-)
MCHASAPATVSELKWNYVVLAGDEQDLVADDYGAVLLFKRQRLSRRRSAGDHRRVPQEGPQAAVADPRPRRTRQRLHDAPGVVEAEGHLVTPITVALRLEALGPLHSDGEPHLVTCLDGNAVRPSQHRPLWSGRRHLGASGEAVNNHPLQQCPDHGAALSCHDPRRAIGPCEHGESEPLERLRGIGAPTWSPDMPRVDPHVAVTRDLPALVARCCRLRSRSALDHTRNPTTLGTNFHILANFHLCCWQCARRRPQEVGGVACFREVLHRSSDIAEEEAARHTGEAPERGHGAPEAELAQQPRCLRCRGGRIEAPQQQRR